jgi:hypothetical protein
MFYLSDLKGGICVRLINLDLYDPTTMKLAHPILDKKRRALLASGQTIPVKYKVLLQEKGIGTVLINDAISDDITLQDRLDVSIWYRAKGLGILLEKRF